MVSILGISCQRNELLIICQSRIRKDLNNRACLFGHLYLLHFFSGKLYHSIASHPSVLTEEKTEFLFVRKEKAEDLAPGMDACAIVTS